MYLFRLKSKNDLKIQIQTNIRAGRAFDKYGSKGVAGAWRGLASRAARAMDDACKRKDGRTAGVNILQ